MKNFWDNGISVEEGKFSMLVLLLVMAFAYVIFVDVKSGFMFTSNVFNVIKWLIAGIAGINGVNALSNMTSSNDRM